MSLGGYNATGYFYSFYSFCNFNYKHFAEINLDGWMDGLDHDDQQ